VLDSKPEAKIPAKVILVDPSSVMKMDKLSSPVLSAGVQDVLLLMLQESMLE